MDPNHELVGWDGTFAPAPVDWDVRSPFRDEQFHMTIQTWAEDTAKALRVYGGPNQLSVAFNRKSIILENAPRYWIPDKEEFESIAEIWPEYLSMPPFPIDLTDINGLAPYWRCYVDQNSCFLNPPNEPQERGISADEEGDKAAKQRASDQGSTVAMRRYNQRLVRRARVDFKKSMKALKAPQPDIIHTEVELYIRPADPKDALQLSSILQYYKRPLSRSCSWEAADTAILGLISACHSEALPFLVAVKKQPHHTQKPQSTIGRRRVLPEDKIYGLAFASSTRPFDDLLRAKGSAAADETASIPAFLEVYIHHDVCNKGVGSALLDVALSALIPSSYYHPYGGKTFVVSADAVLGWKKPITEVQIWLETSEQKTDCPAPYALTWLTSPRWGFEVSSVVHALGEEKLSVTCLRRKIGE